MPPPPTLKRKRERDGERSRTVLWPLRLLNNLFPQSSNLLPFPPPPSFTLTLSSSHVRNVCVVPSGFFPILPLFSAWRLSVSFCLSSPPHNSIPPSPAFFSLIVRLFVFQDYLITWRSVIFSRATACFHQFYHHYRKQLVIKHIIYLHFSFVFGDWQLEGLTTPCSTTKVWLPQLHQKRGLFHYYIYPETYN